MKTTPSAGFPYYIELVGDQNFKSLFHSDDIFNLLAKVTEEKSAYRYTPEKWSIKQILGHMTDHERIMAYRILRFSRKDSTPLSGYDQELLVANARFDEIPFKDLIEDFRNVRNSTISLMKSLSDIQLKLKGVAWKFELSVEGFLKATIGHQLHHQNVLKERYKLID